uniref:pectate lyase family protein n=1 Tax=Peterkaempfera podocarpi TaxID=3232308 RepID=UPI003F573703
MPSGLRAVGPVLGCAVLGLALTAAPAGAADRHSQQTGQSSRIARAALPAGDGWGSADGGTTGGSAADAARTQVASTRAQLVAALGGTQGTDSTPKIVYIRGTIDLNTDADGQPLSCADYATDGYTPAGYLAAYDPGVWGRTAEPSGPLEDARAASAARQAEQVQIRVPSNTTLVGIGGDARILGGGLLLKNVDNVIVRNLTFEDAADCFPQWDPTDTSVGNWNSAYDSLSLSGATHVWVDHATFTDGRNPDSAQPLYFGRPYQVHDGQLDITNGSDEVTASWNVFTQHDKTNLVGSSNTSKTDPGKLRVTFHHNAWEGTIQRAPRVRFGQVDVYNNYYAADDPAAYDYSWGVGVNSQLVAEKNYLRLSGGVSPAQVIYNWGGTAATVDGNLVNGRPVDLLAAFNAANPATPIASGAGWTPALRTRVDNPAALPGIIGCNAGAGRLH